jgi:transcription factor C subunit 7
MFPFYSASYTSVYPAAPHPLSSSSSSSFPSSSTPLATAGVISSGSGGSGGGGGGDDDVEGPRQGQRRGETIEQLHDRVAYTLDRIISNLDIEEEDDDSNNNNDDDDNDSENDYSDGDGVKGQNDGSGGGRGDKASRRRRGPRSMLVCTHAAVVIAIGRVLTGRMPADVKEADFGAYTCGLSVFVRRQHQHQQHQQQQQRQQQPFSALQPLADDAGTLAHWKGGRGVGGGWECVRNSDCSFLAGGAERGW